MLWTLSILSKMENQLNPASLSSVHCVIATWFPTQSPPANTPPNTPQPHTLHVFLLTGTFKVQNVRH